MAPGPVAGDPGVPVAVPRVVAANPEPVRAGRRRLVLDEVGRRGAGRRRRRAEADWRVFAGRRRLRPGGGWLAYSSGGGAFHGCGAVSGVPTTTSSAQRPKREGGAERGAAEEEDAIHGSWDCWGTVFIRVISGWDGSL